MRHLLSCAVMLAALSLMACVGGDSSPASGKSVVFSFAEGGEAKAAALERLARGFEEERGGVRVFLHPLPSSTDAQRVFYLTTLSSRSNFVDVMEADVIWTAEFAAAGLLRELSGAAALADTGRFLPGLLAQAGYGDKLYGAPYYATFGTLFYRADLLAKHKLKPPRTLAELLDQADKVGKAEAISGLLLQAADYEGLACVFFELYACLGDPAEVKEGKVSLDATITRDTLRFLHGAMHLRGAIPRDVLDHTEVDSTAIFGDGEAVFMRGWNGAHGAVARALPPGAVGTMIMPASRGPLSGGFLLAVNGHTDVPELAEAFVEYMLRTDSQRLLARERGQGPALTALYSDDARPAGLPGEGAPAGYLIRPRSPYYFELSQVVTEEVRAVLRGDRTVEEGASRLVARAGKLSLPRRAAPGFPQSSYMTRYRP